MELIIIKNKTILYPKGRLDINHKALNRKDFQLAPLEDWAWVGDRFYMFLYYCKLHEFYVNKQRESYKLLIL